MKRNLLFVILVVICQIATSQDIIQKKDGSRIEAKVMGVGSIEITYKKWSNPDGPNYVVSTHDVLRIQYSNGDVDEFAKATPNFDTVIDRYGDRYIGSMVNGMKEGQGVLLGADGSRYEGNFHNDMRDGQGVFINPSGTRYEGEFKDDAIHGHGKYIGTNGLTYEGAWDHNRRNGYGVAVFSDGNRYEGEWMQNARHGRGAFYFTTGDYYEGDFVNNQMTGKGIYQWKGGNRYVGDFKNGACDGYGICYYTNGNRYEGEWKNDAKNGLGIMYYANGKTKEGEWKDDLCVKQMPIDHTSTTGNQPQSNQVDNTPVKLSQAPVAEVAQPAQEQPTPVQPTQPAPSIQPTQPEQPTEVVDVPVVQPIEVVPVSTPQSADDIIVPVTPPATVTPTPAPTIQQSIVTPEQTVQPTIVETIPSTTSANSAPTTTTKPLNTTPAKPTPAKTTPARSDKTVIICYYNYTDNKGDDVFMKFPSPGIYKEFLIRFLFSPEECTCSLLEVERGDNNKESLVDRFSFKPSESLYLDQGAMATIVFYEDSKARALILDRSEHSVTIDNNYHSGKKPTNFLQFNPPGTSVQSAIDEFNATTDFPHTQAGEPNYNAKFNTILKEFKNYQWR